MSPEHDYELEYTAENGAESRCRVRVWLPDEDGDAPVVMFSELAGNEGQSVTNAAEVIAAEVLGRHDFSAYRLPVFIEHYSDGARGTPGDPHTFDLVTFADHEIRHRRLWGTEQPTYTPLIGEPDWSALDRAAVEALVGERVD